jgi:hypothetical protein
MLRYWKAGSSWLGLPDPRIMVLPDWPGRDSALATCSLMGRELRFWACPAELYPDPLVMAIIAEELIHAFQFARPGPQVSRNKGVVEREAKRLAESWGLGLAWARSQVPGFGTCQMKEVHRKWRQANREAKVMAQIYEEAGYFVTDVVRAPEFAEVRRPANPR